MRLGRKKTSINELRKMIRKKTQKGNKWKKLGSKVGGRLRDMINKEELDKDKVTDLVIDLSDHADRKSILIDDLLIAQTHIKKNYKKIKIPKKSGKPIKTN
jgi:hypothetical protein